MSTLTVQRLSLASQLRLARKRARLANQEPEMRHYYAGLIDGLRFGSRSLRKAETGSGTAFLGPMKRAFALLSLALVLGLFTGCSHIDQNGVLHLTHAADPMNPHWIGTAMAGGPKLTHVQIDRWRNRVIWGPVGGIYPCEYDSVSNPHYAVSVVWTFPSGEQVWIQASKNGNKWRTAGTSLGSGRGRFGFLSGEKFCRVIAKDAAGQEIPSQVFALR